MEERRIEYFDDIPEEISVLVKENENVSLSILSLSKIPSKAKITVNVEKDGVFIGAFADFTDKNIELNLDINLLGEGSSCEWHLASFGGGSALKTYFTNAYHKASSTKALVSNYGIAREKSKIKFAGTSSIEEQTRKTNTRQEAKIIIFDPEADGIASPNLEIKNNDTSASHGAAVGRLNDSHIFYLESRGLSEAEAKRLIAMGYLKPIEKYFHDEEAINAMDEFIEKGISND